MEQTTLSATPEAQVAGSKKIPAAKLKTPPAEVEITIANTPEEVLQYDSEGARIYFACEKGKFLELPDEVVEKLSRWTKTVYQAMKAQNASLEAEDPAWDDIKKRLKIQEALGQAKDRLALDGLDPKFEGHWVRPDTLAKAEQKGWVPLKQGDIAGRTIVKELGKEELIGLKRPKEFRKAQAAARLEKKRKAAAEARVAYEASVKGTGYNPLDRERVARAKPEGWNDV